MNLKRLSQILKNDYVQTIILAVILFVGVFAFWSVLKLGFRTEFPLLAVASGSMEDMLHRGDLIIVQGGLNFTELNADAQPSGEVIVFYDPRFDRAPIYLPVAGETRLIVHRAVSKEVYNNGTWYLQTKGDNNPGNDFWTGSETWNGKISEKLVVGKVVGIVPWLGNIPLFMHENPIMATSIIVFLFAVLIIVDFIFPSKKEGEKKEEKSVGQNEKPLNIYQLKSCAEELFKSRKVIMLAMFLMIIAVFLILSLKYPFFRKRAEI